MMTGVTQPEYEPKISLAKSCRSLDQILQHWFELRIRTADDLQHVAGRGLVFQRFLEIPGAVARLGDQPRVLHRDDRLRGEVLQQRDLLVSEPADFPAINDERAQQAVVFA